MMVIRLPSELLSLKYVCLLNNLAQKIVCFYNISPCILLYYLKNERQQEKSKLINCSKDLLETISLQI